jgi:hypothetical protein
MRHRRPWLILFAVVFGACAGPLRETSAKQTTAALTESPAVPEGSVALNDDLVCMSELPTGSKIPKRVCRTREEMEEERLQAEELIRRSQQKPPERP